MDDKIYLFTIKDRDDVEYKYATTSQTQMDAEYKWDCEISCDHDNINYKVKEVELDDICEDVSWF